MPRQTNLAPLIDELAGRHAGFPGGLLQVLRGVQQQYGWVSRQATDRVTTLFGVRRVDVDGLVDFYAFLSDIPRGDYDIRISDNITDRMAGGRRLLEQLCWTHCWTHCAVDEIAACWAT